MVPPESPFDVSWTVNPFNLLWSIGGALFAGVMIIWKWGGKWQEIETRARKLDDLEASTKKKLDDIELTMKKWQERSELSLAKVHAELDMIKDNSATYRESAARVFPTREELSRLEEKLWTRMHGPAE